MWHTVNEGLVDLTIHAKSQRKYLKEMLGKLITMSDSISVVVFHTLSVPTPNVVNKCGLMKKTSRL